MPLHDIIKTVVSERGSEFILAKGFVGLLADYEAFQAFDDAVYKEILHAAVADGSVKNFCERGKWDASSMKIAQEVAQRNSFDDSSTLYAFESIAYGLGWTKSAPLTAEQKKMKLESELKAKEEATRKPDVEARIKVAEEARLKQEEARRIREEECRRRMEAARRKAELVSRRRAEEENSISVNKTSLIFSAEGGSDTIEITASGFWQLSAVPDNWAVVEKRTGSIAIEVLKNEAGEERTDYLKIKCGPKEVRVDIRQEGSCAIAPRTRKCRPHPMLWVSLSKTLNDKNMNYRLAAFTSPSGYQSCDDKCMLINGANGAHHEGLKGTAIKDVIWNNIGPRNIRSIDFNKKGDYCVIVDGKNGSASDYFASNRSLVNVLEEISEKERITCVSINDKGDYVVVSDKYYRATRKSDRELLLNLTADHGRVQYVCISDLGICIVCENGVLFDNIPQKLAEAFENINFKPKCVYFTDEGHYFIANEDGTSHKTNLI